jgi:hypothetical protein
MLLAAFLSLTCNAARGGLPGPPPSYVVRTADGEHVFVMLSSVPLEDDRGNNCFVPEWGTVSLRDTYPASGLYPLHATAPLWTIDWYNEESWTRISPDGRYVVRINKYGGGHYGERPTSHLAITFYDRNRELKSYAASELVDWLQVMQFTFSGWHYLWVGAFDQKVTGPNFWLATTTSDQYLFDVATGEILKESHVWRHVGRLARTSAPICAAALLLVLACIVWRSIAAREKNLVNEVDCLSTATHGKRKFAFSLKTLFLVMTAGALLLSKPHWFILLAGLAWAIHSTRRLRRSGCRIPLWKCLGRENWRRSKTWIGALTAWAVFYALTFAPLLGVLLHLEAPGDFRRGLALTIYRPVVYLAYRIPFFDSYFGMWDGYWG